MYFYILLKRGKVNLTDVYNASVNYDIQTHTKITFIWSYIKWIENYAKKQTKLPCFWIKNSNFGRFVFQICPQKKERKTHKNKDDKRVLCSFVNIKHVLHKKGRKKKQITFHIKSFTLWFHAFKNIANLENKSSEVWILYSETSNV
jgi:hypothetical protein